ncbi:MAG: class I SAM-dependent methyltransferase [bacterium]
MNSSNPHSLLLDRCRLCGSHKLRWFDRDYRDTEISRCIDCGVCFSNPQPTEAQLNSLYSDYDGRSRADRKVETAVVDAKPSGERELPGKERNVPSNSRHDYNFGLIERFISPGRVLSVGCGGGGDLLAARRRGWEVEGLEIDETRAAKTKERTGCPVKVGDFLELDPAESTYECVYMNHVLEHPLDPGAFIRKTHELLSPTGIFWVAAPNIASITNQLKTLAGRLRLKERRGKHYACWHHLFFFNPARLSALLEDRYGFDVVCSQGELKPKQGRVSRLRERTYRTLPNLKSNFQIVAQKR